MRVWLKTLEQMGTRRWSEPEPFERIEHALLRWLSIPIKKRVGGLIHEARESRKPTDDEVRLGDGRVNMGILIVSRDLARAYPHCIRVEEQDRNLDSDFPRVRLVMLPWRTYEERDVITKAEEADGVRRLGSARGFPHEAPGTGPAERLRAKVVRGPEPVEAPVEDVVDAVWTEIGDEPRSPASPGRAGGEASSGASNPEPVAPEPPEGLDVPRYRTALLVCRGLSPASGPAYRAACDEATERLEDFLGLPQPASARKAARTAHGLLNALPRHFPSAGDAGRWAMEARPALGAFAEAAFAWAANPPVAAIAPVAETVSAAPPPPDTAPVDPRHSQPPQVQEIAEPVAEPVAEPAAETAAAPAGDASPETDAAPMAVAVADPLGVDAGPKPPEEVEPAPKRRRRPARSKPAPVEAKAEAVAGPSPVEVPAQVPAPEPEPKSVAAAEAGAGFPRRLTAGERKVMSVMSVRVAMRKNEIARAAGIGRGSANRHVDRLVDIGACREALPLRYVLTSGRS